MLYSHSIYTLNSFIFLERSILICRDLYQPVGIPTYTGFKITFLVHSLKLPDIFMIFRLYSHVLKVLHVLDILYQVKYNVLYNNTYVDKNM